MKTLMLILLTGLMACKPEVKPMKSMVAIFEIPANDIDRAIKFYENVLSLKIEKVKAGNQEMGILPYENQASIGVLVKSKNDKPGSNGVTIYLNAENKIEQTLSAVEKNGGKIVTPKTAHADDSGFFALFIDSEGNKLGLHSSK